MSKPKHDNVTKVELPFVARPRDGAYVAAAIEGAYKDGLRDGAWQAFHANGQRKQDYHWERGVQHGPELDWYDTGKPLCDGRNVHGKRVGTWTWFHANGNYQEALVYDDDGRIQGPYEHRTAGGVVDASGTYLDGERHGDWVWRNTAEHERYELGYHRGQRHGKEAAWFVGGKLAIARTWYRGDKHGEDATFSADGPLFEGTWVFGLPVGEHVVWEDGKPTRTKFVDGIPENVAGDAKLRTKLLKAFAKAAKKKDEYAKGCAFDDVDGASTAAYVVHLWRGGHVDAAAEPALWGKLAEAHGLFSGDDVVALLGKANTKAASGQILPNWPRELDELVMRVYARDPAPIDRAWQTLPKHARSGVALVRARFGHDIGDALHGEIARLVAQHQDSYYEERVMWPDDGGVVCDQVLRDRSGAHPPRFDTLRGWFGSAEDWRRELQAAMNQVIAKDDRLNLVIFRDAIAHATPDEVARALTAAALDNDTHDQIRAALTAWRRDDAATTTAIALAVADTGLRKWPAVSAAILAHAAAGTTPPDALVDALELADESPTYTGSWYRDPVAALPDARKTHPCYRTAYLGSAVGLAVPRMAQLRAAMRALGVDRARRVIERALDSEYGKRDAAQYLYLVPDPALWERFLDLMEHDKYGADDRVVYGIGELGRPALELIAARCDRATAEPWQQGYAKAMVVALARAIADDGAFAPGWDRFVTFALDDYDTYAPFVERIVCKLPERRGEAILLAALADASAQTFARAFAVIAACPTRPVLERAFTTLLDREAKLDRDAQICVARGIVALDDGTEWVRWLLRSGGGGGIAGALKDVFGWQTIEAIERELAQAGVAKAPEIDRVDKLRMLAEDAGGRGERVYVLRRLDDSGDDGTCNRIGGAAPGIAAARWPQHDGEPMTHLFTLDVATMPELAERVGADVRAVSVFCWNPDLNEAYEPGTPQTAVVLSTAAQLADAASPPDDVVPRAAERFEVVAIDVAPNVWNGDSPLRRQLYAASARVLGEPLWLQDDEDGAGAFVMQFDSGFCDVNLGDSGVMYVFGNDAFWQCH